MFIVGWDMRLLVSRVWPRDSSLNSIFAVFGSECRAAMSRPREFGFGGTLGFRSSVPGDLP